jgi:SAM-dependent methyltransferase
MITSLLNNLLSKYQPFLIKKIMTYVLQNEKEADRLKRQSEAKEFDVAAEISHLKIKANSNVLEIGCGAGTLINYLFSNNHIMAAGCDLQLEHVKFCKENSPESIDFFQHDIVKQRLTDKYDYIFMRYMTHHLGSDLFLKAMENVKHGLKPAGKVVVIDIDGLFENIGTIDMELAHYFRMIEDNFTGDLKMGRKISSLFNQVGLKDIKYEIQTVDFQGEAREVEIAQMKDRLTFAKDAFIEVLGSELDYHRFYKLFMEKIKEGTTTYFINKFITQGSLPS